MRRRKVTISDRQLTRQEAENLEKRKKKLLLGSIFWKICGITAIAINFSALYFSISLATSIFFPFFIIFLSFLVWFSNVVVYVLSHCDSWHCIQEQDISNIRLSYSITHPLHSHCFWAFFVVLFYGFKWIFCSYQCTYLIIDRHRGKTPP